MSEPPDKESKTEDATEQKRRDALQKGTVPFSREAGSAASFLAILIIVALTAPDAALRICFRLRHFVDDPDSWQIATSADAGHLAAQLGRDILVILAPTLLIMMVAGIGAAVLQNPPQLVGSRIKPDASRISIAKGWSRIFGRQGLVEFAKSVFKVATVAAIAVLTMRIVQFDIFNALALDPAALPQAIRTGTLQMVAGMLVALLVLGVADILWSRFSWARELRMTRQEIKDEHKQSEGDPIIKAKLRSLARDRNRRSMLTAVPRATLVIVNPTHYAVALRFVRAEGGAPVVIAKGRDLIALKIREIAEAQGIPVIEDKALARSLHASVEVEMLIPPEFYKAVAAIILMLARRGAYPAMTSN